MTPIKKSSGRNKARSAPARLLGNVSQGCPCKFGHDLEFEGPGGLTVFSDGVYEEIATEYSRK